jgi:hypothetical protein
MLSFCNWNINFKHWNNYILYVSNALAWTFLFITILLIVCVSQFRCYYLYNVYASYLTCICKIKTVGMHSKLYMNFFSLCKLYLYASYSIGSCLFIYKFLCLYVFISFEVSLYAYLSMQVSLFMHLAYKSRLHHVYVNPIYIFFMFPCQLSWSYV